MEQHPSKHPNNQDLNHCGQNGDNHYYANRDVSPPEIFPLKQSAGHPPTSHHWVSVTTIKQTLVEVFIPLDRFYQQTGDFLFHCARTIFFQCFGNFGDHILCFLPHLLLNIIVLVLAVIVQFLNIQQALLRAIIKQLCGDRTRPDILWRRCMFVSLRDRSFL